MSVARAFTVCVLLGSAACSSTDKDSRADASDQSFETPPTEEAQPLIGSMTAQSVIEQVSQLEQSERFIQLQSVLKEDWDLALDTSRAEGWARAEGDVLLIPVVNSDDGLVAGRVVISDVEWAVGIDQGDELPTGYLVTDDGAAKTLVLQPMPIPDNDPHSEASSVTKSVPGLQGCQYVSFIGAFHLACINFGSNPLGYYYEQTSRVGIGDPSTPQWWACYHGGLHVCPENEYEFSPVIVTLCGFAPNHPTG